MVYYLRLPGDRPVGIVAAQIVRFCANDYADEMRGPRSGPRLAPFTPPSPGTHLGWS